MTSKLHFRNTKQHWVAAAILAPLLLITVPVTAFILAGYIGSEIPLHFPSGSYKEVLNVRQVTDRKLFDAAAQCFAGRGLPHRIIKNSSIQVQESLFRTSIERCWNELNNAKLSTQALSGCRRNNIGIVGDKTVGIFVSRSLAAQLVVGKAKAG